MSGGDPSVFVRRPISLAFIIATVLILVVMIAPAVRKRRAEIAEDFDREVYGRVPKETPKVKWEVTATNKQTDLVMIPLRMALWQRDREDTPP